MEIFEFVHNRNYYSNNLLLIDNKRCNKIINIAINNLFSLIQVFHSDWRECKRSFWHFISKDYEVKSMLRMLNEDLPRLSIVSVILISITVLILIKQF